MKLVCHHWPSWLPWASVAERPIALPPSSTQGGTHDRTAAAFQTGPIPQTTPAGPCKKLAPGSELASTWSSPGESIAASPAGRHCRAHGGVAAVSRRAAAEIAESVSSECVQPTFCSYLVGQISGTGPPGPRLSGNGMLARVAMDAAASGRFPPDVNAAADGEVVWT